MMVSAATLCHCLGVDNDMARCYVKSVNKGTAHMNMSKACEAPRQPPISEKDRQHPDFARYMAYRAGCNSLLVECSRFDDWLAQDAAQAKSEQWAQHARYPEFLAWMRETRGGTPGKTTLTFPRNFIAWLGGTRW
jgi:hypothetical protein